jgi:integrase
MKFKARRDWRKGQSIIKGRSRRGQIVWNGMRGAKNIFLVRIGKDIAERVVGSKDDAKLALKRLTTGQEGGHLKPRRGRLRFGTLLTKHYLPAKYKSLKPKTYGEYVRTIEREIIPALGHHTLATLCATAIQKWVDSLWERGLRPKTIKEYFSLVRAPLRWATDRGYIHVNPALAVDISQRADEWWLAPDDELEGVDVINDEESEAEGESVWSVEEMVTFFQAAPHDDEMTRWVRVALRSGLRPGEQCALRWSNIDLSSGTLSVTHSVIEVDKSRRKNMGRWVLSHVPKTGGRVILLPPDAISALVAQKAYLDGLLADKRISAAAAKFLFPARKGKKPYNNPGNMRNRLSCFIDGRASRAKPGGLPGVRRISLYGLRHTHATDLLRNSWPVWDVAKRLGTSVEMIQRHYGHLLPDLQVGRMEAMTQLDGGS